MNINVGHLRKHVQALIHSLQAMDPTVPSDPDTPLEALADESVVRH
jgi:hypothetical protein